MHIAYAQCEEDTINTQASACTHTHIHLKIQNFTHAFKPPVGSTTTMFPSHSLLTTKCNLEFYVYYFLIFLYSFVLHSYFQTNKCMCVYIYTFIHILVLPIFELSVNGILLYEFAVTCFFHSMCVFLSHPY